MNKAKRTFKGRSTQGKGWLEYERRKAEWKRNNPSSTPAQYDRAVARIARECGV